MALHAMRIELGAEEIALIRRAEALAAIEEQTGGRDAGELGHHRHEIAGAFELAGHRIRFRINAAPDPMHQRIALAIARILKVGHGPEGLAGRQKSQLDGIIEAATRHPFETRSVRADPPDARGLAFELAAIFG